MSHALGVGLCTGIRQCNCGAKEVQPRMAKGAVFAGNPLEDLVLLVYHVSSWRYTAAHGRLARLRKWAERWKDGGETAGDDTQYVPTSGRQHPLLGCCTLAVASQRVSTCLNVSQRVSTCLNVSQRVSTCLSRSEPIYCQLLNIVARVCTLASLTLPYAFPVVTVRALAARP